MHSHDPKQKNSRNQTEKDESPSLLEQKNPYVTASCVVCARSRVHANVLYRKKEKSAIQSVLQNSVSCCVTIFPIYTECCCQSSIVRSELKLEKDSWMLCYCIVPS